MTNSISAPKALTITAAEFDAKNKFKMVEEAVEAQLIENKDSNEEVTMTFKEAEVTAVEETAEEEIAAEVVAPAYKEDVIEALGLMSILVIADSKNGYKLLTDEDRLSRMIEHFLSTYGKDALAFFICQVNSKITEAMLSSDVLLNHLAEIVCNFAIYQLSRLASKGTNHETEFKPILEEYIKCAYIEAISKVTNTKISEEDIAAAISVYKESTMEVVYAVFQEKYNRSIFGCADF